jgi:hypothetical protein
MEPSPLADGGADWFDAQNLTGGDHDSAPNLAPDLQPDLRPDLSLGDAGSPGGTVEPGDSAEAITCTESTSRTLFVLGRQLYLRAQPGSHRLRHL